MKSRLGLRSGGPVGYSSAAIAAEPFSRRVLAAAAAALPRQRPSAVAAEFPTVVVRAAALANHCEHPFSASRASPMDLVR